MSVVGKRGDLKTGIEAGVRQLYLHPLTFDFIF